MMIIGVVQSSARYTTPTGSVLPTITSNSLSLSNGIIGGNFSYSSPVSQLEKNIKPIITGVVVSGTTLEANVINVTISVSNNTGYGYLNNTIQVYRGTAIDAVTPVLVTTLSGNGLTFQYTIMTADVGSYLTFKATVRLNNGDVTVSDSIYSDYSTIVTALPSVLDVFDRWRLQIENIDADWNSNSSATWQNIGNSGNAIRQTANPELVLSGVSLNTRAYLDFVRASSEYISIPKGTIAEGTTYVFVVYWTTLAGVIQNLMANTGSNYIRVGSGNQYQINNVNGGLSPTATQWSIVRIRFNGASSFIQINNNGSGGKATFDNTSQSFSSGNANIGTSFTNTNFANMRIRFIGRASGNIDDSGSDWTNAYNELYTKYVA